MLRWRTERVAAGGGGSGDCPTLAEIKAVMLEALAEYPVAKDVFLVVTEAGDQVVTEAGERVTDG